MLQPTRYRRAEFGRPLEKLARDIEQLQPAIETLETEQAGRLARLSPAVPAAVETASSAQQPARRRLPEGSARPVKSCKRRTPFGERAAGADQDQHMARQAKILHKRFRRHHLLAEDAGALAGGRPDFEHPWRIESAGGSGLAR